jgi:HAD superfamily hydrolase (TIGR01548 family)
MKPFNLIVFDMDGVLIDVSGSYREAARKTARRFLAGAKGCEKLPEPLFPMEDLAHLKESGGLNNDWELTAALLHLLFLHIETVAPCRPAKNTPFEETIKMCSVCGLADFLRKSQTPLMSLQRQHLGGKSFFVDSCFRGDVKTGNVIKRMFQEIYLGSSLFRSTYGIAPKFSSCDGLINNESLLCDKELLKRLAESNTLAIATGRPAVEANYTLRRFKIEDYFKEVITLDDVAAKERAVRDATGKTVMLSKPHPFMLDFLAEKTIGPFERLAYIGDMPDDMQAASASKNGYRGIGVVSASPDPAGSRKRLLEAGAKDVIEHLSELPRLFG